MANTNSMKQIALTCSGHTRPVTHLDFSDITESGNSFLISACKDGKPMLRLGDTGDWVGTFEGHKGAVFGVGLNRKATLAASGAADFSAKLWDAISGEEKCNYQHNHTVKSVAFDEDSTHLLTGNNEKLIRVFDLNQPSTNPAVEIYAGHTGAIKRALFCRNDKCIISCAEDKAIRIWDRSSGQEIHKIDFPCNPSNIEISRDGSILTIANGMNVTFYEANSWNKIKEVAVPSKLADASLHPDKLVFVCGGEDFKIYKFDYMTGNEIQSFKGHFGPVHCISFSPDGELYASGSEDGTLRLWQTTVGKTYGLWKCINGPEGEVSMNNTSPREVTAN
jgi:serine-threonine kinase receptor-associated protein